MTVTTEALRKGKPSKGTKKDKRLDENQYADGPEHFYGEVVTAAWDGSSSRFSDPQYQKACAACDPGDGTTKERCFLPHHDPGGGLNKDGLHAAAQRISSLAGHSPEAVAKAKAHLRSHYGSIGEDVPDVLKASALEAAAFGVEDGYEALAFVSFAMEDDCGPGMEKDPGTDKCIKSGEGKSEKAPEGDSQQKSGMAGETLAEESSSTAPWRGPLTVEGIETGDGREFDNNSLTWADLPLPLRWNRVDSHGGEARTEAVNVGRIDKVWREDNGLIMGEGVLDLSDDDGRRAHSKVKSQMLRGVSVDVDSIKDADMELIWAEPDPDGENEPDPFAQMFAAPEKVVFHKGRIRAATLVDIPAFAEAYIALLDEAGAVVAGGQRAGQHRQFGRTTVLTRNAVDVPPVLPAEWFANPDLSVPTGITVTPEGRVYGHAALWGTCHIGQAGMCVTPPHEESHPYFMTGAVACGEESMAAVGQITVDTNHADLSLSYRAAADHYDNTGAAVADVTVGNDVHGIWVAGSVRRTATEAQVHALRASGQVSGDWRNVGGSLRLVGLLAVNVPGFPVPKLRTTYAGGSQRALVAAGMTNLREQLTEDELDQLAYRRIMGRLGQRVHGGK